MAEQVSVRLAVVGGTQFRSELTSAGRDGSAAMDQISASSRRLGPQVQNASYQIGDFAVQVASGQSASRAFAQQMPQLLGGFGMIGAVAGAAVAVMAALAPLFFKSAEGSAELVKEMGGLEGSIGGVESATSALEAMQREYNNTIAQTGGASSAAAATVAANSKAEFAARKEVLAIEMELLRIRGQEKAAMLQNLEDTYKLEADAVIRSGARQYQGETSSNNPNGRSRLRGDPQQAKEFDAFLARTEKTRLAMRKLRVEAKETDITLKRSEELLNTKFEDITTGGTGKDAPGDGTKGGKSGGGTSQRNEALKVQQKLFDETRTKAEAYAIELDRIEALYRSGAISTEVYERKLDLLKEQYETQGKFAASVATTLKSSMDSLFDSMWEGGKKAAESVENLGKKLASMAFQQSTYQLLARLMPNTFGAGGFIPLLANADGNAFSAGRVTAFAAGGVVSGATMFPMRGGTGLMGEAGPEAIMPLTRIGGKLGVRSAGGGGGGGQVVQIIDQRGKNAPEIERSSRSGPDGTEYVTMVIKDATARGDMDGTNRARYGSAPKKVRR